MDWGNTESTGDTPQMRYLVGIKSGKGISTDQVDTDGQFPVYGGNGVMGYTNSSNCFWWGPKCRSCRGKVWSRFIGSKRSVGFQTILLFLTPINDEKHKPKVFWNGVSDLET